MIITGFSFLGRVGGMRAHVWEDTKGGWEQQIDYKPAAHQKKGTRSRRSERVYITAECARIQSN
jgi:hypothetical protein